MDKVLDCKAEGRGEISGARNNKGPLSKEEHPYEP